jgi:hypothetical protein
MKHKFPITPHIRAELQKAGIHRFRHVRVDADSYAQLREMVENGGYGHLTPEERHAIAVGCCMTHPIHRKKNIGWPWWYWAVAGAVLLIVLIFAQRAVAQGTQGASNAAYSSPSLPVQTSQIDVITFRDSTGAVIRSFASPFSIKCSTNVTCSAAGSTLTVTAAGGGAGGGYATIQNNGVAIAQETIINFLGALACVDDAANTRSNCQLTANIAVSKQFLTGVDSNGNFTRRQPDVSDLTASACTDNQILVMTAGVPVCVDPTMWGPDNQGAVQTKGPLLQGGRDYTDGNVYALAVDHTTHALVMSLPQQSFLNTQIFSDVNAASPTRGDIVTAQGATPKWSRLAIGTTSQVLFGGTEPAWATTTLLNAGLMSDTASSTVNSGDIVYGNSTPKWADLASPTTTGRAVLAAVPTYQVAPAAPSLTVQNGGGTIAQNTTVFVRIKLKYPNGDTAGSVETSILTSLANGCTASCTVTVALNASICQPTANGQTATGCDVYDSTTTGAEKLQTTLANCQNIAANCVIGTVGAGASISSVNTATIVGPVQWKRDPIVYPCDFSGASAFAQIQLAINALPDPGGIVDARCFGGGTQFGNNSQIILGSTTKRVQLLVDNATDYEIGYTGGSDVIQIANDSCIIGFGPAWQQGVGSPVGGFITATGAVYRALVAPFLRDGTQENMCLEHVILKGDSTVTPSVAILDIEGVADGTQIQDSVIFSCNAPCVFINGPTGVGTGQIFFKNTWINGSGLTASVPLQMRIGGANGQIKNVSFFGGTINNSGSGKNLIDIDCSTGAAATACQNFNWFGTYLEATQAGMTTAVSIKDANNIGFFGLQLDGNTVTNGFSLAQSVAGATHDIAFFGVNVPLSTNFLNDTINTKTYAGTNGTLWVWNGTVMQLGAIPNSIITNSGAINTTETIIVKSFPITANRLVAGTVIRATLVGTCTSTAANTSTFAIRIGTAGTTADAIVFSGVTATAATSGTAVPFRAVLEMTIKTIGAAATAQGTLTVENTGGTSTGISIIPVQVILPTMTTFNTTSAGNFISVTYKSAATTTTSTFVQAFLEPSLVQ